MMDTRCRVSERCWVIAALALLSLGPIGCGSGEVLGKVSGQVTFQGKPVPDGRIIFTNAQKGVHITAELDPEGRYVVEMAKGHGLPLGTYQVWLSPPLVDHPVGPIVESPKTEKCTNIPAKYRDPKTSGLTLVVKEAGNKFNVDMTP